MLSRQLTTIGLLKQAYKLSPNKIDVLLTELLPDNVFPFTLWEHAYERYWRPSIQINSVCYHFDVLQFPDTALLLAKPLTFVTYMPMISRFWDDLVGKCGIADLEIGLDYIIEDTYGDGVFPFADAKNALFASLYEEFEKSILHRTSGPLVIKSMASTRNEFIVKLFFDSITVDKYLTVKFFGGCGYEMFPHTVNGLSHRLVDSILNSTTKAQSDLDEQAQLQKEYSSAVTSAVVEPSLDLETGNQPQIENGNIIAIPAELWKGKHPASVRDSMKAEYADCIIAYVLFNWCGTQKTTIGKLLSEEQYKDDKSYRNITNELLKKNQKYSIIKS